MPRVFSITTPSDTVQLDAKGQGQVTFVVTNNAHHPLQCQFKLRVQEGTQEDWLSFEPSEPISATAPQTAQGLEREFAEIETHQVVVKVSVPARTPHPTQHPYTFRIDAISTHNPDEDYTEGPSVAIALPAAKKNFPWWILVVLAAIAAIGGVVGYIIWKAQPSYIEMPNLVGLPVDEATALLTESDGSDTDVERSHSVNVAVEYQTIVICETPDEAVILPNHVLGQTPTTGESVTRNDTVTLIAVAEDSTVAVPNVQGLSISDAQTRLTACYLQPNLETRVALNETPGQVFEQNPTPGNTVTLNSTVTLTLPSEAIEMINVRGFDQSTATLQLETLGFVVTDVEIIASESDVGTVISQVPPPNTTHPPGTEVQLTVAGETISIPQPDRPNLSGTPLYGVISLETRFHPDPHIVEVRAGGSSNAAPMDLGNGCVGYIAINQPDVRVHYQHGSLPLAFQVFSEEDTTLLVNAPDGRWFCNDDTNGLNPEVSFRSPLSGQYDIWVGTFNSGTIQPARLEITELVTP